MQEAGTRVFEAEKRADETQEQLMLKKIDTNACPEYMQARRKQNLSRTQRVRHTGCLCGTTDRVCNEAEHLQEPSTCWKASMDVTPAEVRGEANN